MEDVIFPPLPESSCCSPGSNSTVRARKTSNHESQHLMMEEGHAEVLDNYHRSQAMHADIDSSNEQPRSLHNEASSIAALDTLDTVLNLFHEDRSAPISLTPDSVSGEFESALFACSGGKSATMIPRSDSLDRRLNEAAQFFQAVGEAPPTCQNELQHIIEDDNDDSDEEAKSTEIRILEGNDPKIRLFPEDATLHRHFSHEKVSLLRRAFWPFSRMRKENSPFLHSLPSEVRTLDFVYKGIQANPPEVVKRGTARGNYSQLHRKAWLEVSDPKHRYGKNLRLYYRHWEALNFPTKNFFDWLDSEGEAEGLSRPELEQCLRTELDSDTVLYISDDQITKRYALSVKRDVEGRGIILDVDGHRVCTGSDGWIFVLRDDVLYGAEKVTKIMGEVRQRFHHSSFFGGKAVSAAGIIITDADGVLTHLFPHSGHYRPGEADMQRMLFYLHRQGVDLRTFEVDTQQLIYINRNDAGSKKDECGRKKKKTESLHLKPAVTVAHYLSHKARMIGESGNGVFSQIHQIRTLDENSRTVRRALDLIDNGGYWNGLFEADLS